MSMSMITPALFLSNIVPNTMAGLGIPTRSLDFESSSSQYLSMSDANFGAFNHAKFAVSFWYKRESIGAIMCPVSKDGGTNTAFRVQWNASNNIQFITSTDGAATDGVLTTTATFSDTASWHHIMAHFDSANATSGDRMRLWHDGSEITSFGTDTAPTGAIFDSSTAFQWGRGIPASGHYYDGLLFQLAFFSGTLPSIGSIYNAGSPINIIGLAGLYSLLNTNASDALEDDVVLVANWTNNNTAIKSTDVPV